MLRRIYVWKNQYDHVFNNPIGVYCLGGKQRKKEKSVFKNEKN